MHTHCTRAGPGRRHPFTGFTVTLQNEYEHLLPQFLEWIEDEYDAKGRLVRPRHLRDGPYFAHIDLSKNVDATGFAVAHVVGAKQVSRGFGRERKFEEKPVIRLDLALEVIAPQHGEIRISSIREILYQLRDLGMQFGKVSYDSWGSEESIQTLNGEGFLAENLSVDTDPAPYESAKEAIYDERLLGYEMPVLEMEPATVRRDDKTGKIDHSSHGCFDGKVRVALADGTVPTFEELAERFGDGGEFAVYSMSPAGVGISMARNPRVTRTNAEMLEVVLDNWQVIECTLDQPFMLLDGSFAVASDLRERHRLMPLYRTSSQKGGWPDYERVWCPVRRQRLLTHHLAAGSPRPGWIVHHKDGVRRNNDPRNLDHLERRGHNRYHTVKRWETDPSYIQKFRDGRKRYREGVGREKSRANILSLFERGILKRGRADCIVEGCAAKSNAKGMCDVHYQRWRRIKLKASRTASQKNHRVLSVRHLPTRRDAWDITVPEWENFALAAGVFVHNS